jgi:hypothetical protein
MKPFLTSIAFALAVTSAIAQTPQTALTRLEKPTFEALAERYTSVKTHLIQLVEIMPDAEYGFRPTPVMEAFGMRVAHAADMNFEQCAYLVGKPNPHAGESLERTFTKKADLVTLLKASFDFCDIYMNRLSRAAMAETVAAPHPTRPSIVFDVELGGPAIGVVTHNVEMYGYMAVYLRLKGLVPPTSGR